MTAVNFGVTFEEQTLTRLDKLRGDVPRSVFLERLVEKELKKSE